MSTIEHIAKTWGDGHFHFGTRQTFDITGIPYENIAAVNAYLEQYIKEVEIELCSVDMNQIAGEPYEWQSTEGYPTIGARNITACIGNYHCICGNVNTFEFARRIEPIVFTSHYHIKINISGCPNYCNKAHMCDFGIIGTARTEYHPERCIACGECVIACPTGAWTRNPDKFYKVILGGRTVRQTPRAGKMFLNWASEEVIINMLKNLKKLYLRV